AVAAEPGVVRADVGPVLVQVSGQPVGLDPELVGQPAPWGDRAERQRVESRGHAVSPFRSAAMITRFGSCTQPSILEIPDRAATSGSRPGSRTAAVRQPAPKIAFGYRSPAPASSTRRPAGSPT